jgi:hypothetical protein
MDDPIWILQKTQHLRVTVNSFVHFIDSTNSVKLFNRTKTQCIAECSEIVYLLSLISLPLAQPDYTPAFIDCSSPMRLTTRPSLGITAVSAVEFSVEVAINPLPVILWRPPTLCRMSCATAAMVGPKLKPRRATH